MKQLAKKRCWNCVLRLILEKELHTRKTPTPPQATPMRPAVLLLALVASASLSTGVLAASKKFAKSARLANYAEPGGNCGPGNGNVQCRPTQCCSAAGFCGTGPAWCGTGCQVGTSGAHDVCISCCARAHDVCISCCARCVECLGQCVRTPRKTKKYLSFGQFRGDRSM
jgi:hypothetical protein